MDPNSPAPVQQPNSFIPSSWPGAFGLYKHSKDVVTFNLSPVLTLMIISMIISFVASIVSDRETSLSIVASIVQLFASIALIFALLSSVRGVKMPLDEAIKKSFSLITVKYIVLFVLLAFILVVSFLLFIVPFFFVLPRIALAPYILIAENAGIVESLNKSWELTKGNAGKSWGIIGVSFLFGLLCVVLIGFYFLIMYAAAFPLLYLFLKGQGSVPVADSVPHAVPAQPVTATPLPPAPVQ